MTLNIGDNIRKHRRNMKLTQEQLAEKFGVSFQAISRWENGTTYPDMELLPSIAKFFGITVDQLLGCPEEEQNKKAEQAFHNLAIATYETPINKDKIIDLIRDIRRNHLESEQIWRFWLDVKQSVYLYPEILDEVRLTVQAILDGSSNTYERNQAISYMSALENDENIENFIAKQASDMDISKEALLLKRYRFRQQWDKYKTAQQWEFCMMIDKMIGNSDPWRDRGKPMNLDEFAYMNQTMLAFLHRINCIVPDESHPVTGNGEIDFWTEPRLWMGFRLASCFASSGELEKAFIYLEDSVDLLEKFLSITDPIEIKCNSPWLDEIKWTAQEDWVKPNCLPDEPFERCVYLHHEGTCYMFYPSWFYSFLVSDTDCWKWFDPIRNYPKFIDCVERVKRLIVTK